MTGKKRKGRGGRENEEKQVSALFKNLDDDKRCSYVSDNLSFRGYYHVKSTLSAMVLAYMVVALGALLVEKFGWQHHCASL